MRGGKVRGGWEKGGNGGGIEVRGWRGGDVEGWDGRVIDLWDRQGWFIFRKTCAKDGIVCIRPVSIYHPNPFIIHQPS